MTWPLPRRPLQAMASLHHLSLGLQNATLGTFAGVGFRRFWLDPAGVLLFRNHALLSSLGLFRSYAPESSLRMKWPLPRRPLQAMASLHHLSLGPQNATLGTFAGVGFRRFGLESCWGSAVSQPRSTELLGAVSELCSREFLADEVASSTGAAPGNGIIASSFFRASERNVIGISQPRSTELLGAVSEL